jgi:hypothetical protein
MKASIHYVLATMIFASASPAISAEPLEREIAVKAVFVPGEGYDDNDNVEIVIDGSLPNACFTLGRTETSVSEDMVITVRQFALRQADRVCIESELSDFALIPVPFSKDVALGNLSKGNYTINYKTGNTVTASATFGVAEAPTETIDNMAYAPVSDAYVPAGFLVNAAGKAKITGYLTSSCMQLDTFDVARDPANGVIVVLPRVKQRLQGACLQYIRPFEKEIDIGNFAEGRYLLHVRSMNGKSVNRVFSVMTDTSSH